MIPKPWDLVLASTTLAGLLGVAFGPLLVAKPATKEKATAVRLVYFPNLTHAPVIAGVARGTYAKAFPNDRFETKVVVEGAAAVEAILAGAADAAYLGPSPAINGYVKGKGKTLRLLAGGCEGGASLIARGDVPIATIADLGNRRISVPVVGSTQEISLRKFIEPVGLVPKDKGGTVDILPIKNPDVLSLFKQKQLDAAWSPEPWASRLRVETGAKTVADERDLWPNGRFTTVVLIVSAKFLRERPDAVAILRKAHREAVAWTLANPVEAKKTVNAAFGGIGGKALPPKVLDEAWSKMTFTVEPDLPNLQAQADAAFRQGFLRGRPDLSGFPVSGGGR